MVGVRIVVGVRFNIKSIVVGAIVMQSFTENRGF